MIVYKDHATFTILGVEVDLYSDKLELGQNTVAEMEKRLHYLGKEDPTIAAAILAWQEINGRELTDSELHQVLVDNNLSTSTM